MAADQLFKELANGLAGSDSELRKHWADRIVNENVSLDSLISLLHGEHKTAQRFMWLLDDVCRIDPDRMAPFLPLLFSLRDQMPFPGIRRSITKWLFLTRIPESVEPGASKQMVHWLESQDASIACKSFSAKCLFLMATENRFQAKRLHDALKTQADHPNRAYRSRIQKFIDRLDP